MHKKRTLWIYLALFSILSACTLPATRVTQISLNNPSYTAAAETINAQLTGLALPTGTPIAGAAQELPNTPAIVEQASTGTALAATLDTTLSGTLPATSTPLPSSTPRPSDTPAPTSSPQPTLPLPTADPSQNPGASLGEADWQDSFVTAANWPIYSDQHVEMRIKDGSLEVESLYNDKWESWMLTSADLTNFYLELQAVPGQCAGYDRYGLLARAPSATQGYLFGFTCDGRYSVRIWNGQSFLMVIPWTTSEHILKGPDQTNVLGFWAEGNLLRVYANGKFLAEVQDDTLSSGSFGIFSAAFNTPGFTTQFKEMTYWELP